jgi:hypothetical protein
MSLAFCRLVAYNDLAFGGEHPSRAVSRFGLGSHAPSHLFTTPANQRRTAKAQVPETVCARGGGDRRSLRDLLDCRAHEVAAPTPALDSAGDSGRSLESRSALRPRVDPREERARVARTEDLGSTVTVRSG